jgi:hypothetical protein
MTIALHQSCSSASQVCLFLQADLNPILCYLELTLVSYNQGTMSFNRLRCRAYELAVHAGPSTLRIHLLSLPRSFSTTARRSAQPVGHYDALKLPKNATKQQVKARFYEVSSNCRCR